MAVEVSSWEGMLVIYCCVTNCPHNFQLTTADILYFIVSVGPSSGHGSTWYLGLKVSEELAVRLSAGVAVSSEA